MHFDTHAYTDYKALVRERTQWLKRQKPSLTLKKIASRVPMQYTYLSKALNDECTHLNEDHLFRVCKELEFFGSEIDFVLLLRSHATAQEADRREYISSRIDEIRKKRGVVTAEHQEFSPERMMRETQFLLDPMAVLVHVALFIKTYRADPRQLCSHLGITTKRLGNILETLEKNELIRRGDDRFEIVEVLNRKRHFGKEHPLMRIHQGLVKSALHNRLQQTSEEDKESFQVTFCLDEPGFEKARAAFQAFIKELQSIFESSEGKGLYQLNFDLARWF